MERQTYLQPLHGRPRAPTHLDRLCDLRLERGPVTQGLDPQEFEEREELFDIVLPFGFGFSKISQKEGKKRHT
jgi:hypothetical protein